MDFLDTLSPTIHVITPNKRLAANISDRYNTRTSLKQTAWISLNACSYETWLTKTWSELSARHYLSSRILLNPFQVTMVWESIIRNSTHDHPLLNVLTATQQATQAFERIKAWCIDVDHPQFLYYQSSAFFKKWARQFTDYCDRHHVMTVQDIPDLLIQHADLLKQELTGIHWIGFTEFSPQQQRLIDTFTALGISQKVSLVPDNFTATTHYIALNNRNDEIEAMAQWANQQSKNHLVACIVPGLESNRHKIEMVFTRVCGGNNYNISGGLPLNSYPILFSALRGLCLNDYEISIETLSHILRSPYFSHAHDEDYPQALIDLSSINKNSFTQQELLSLLKNKPAHKKLYKTLQSFFTLTKNIRGSKSVHEWSGIFHQQLLALHWPGKRTVDSHEYQSLERWKKLMLEYRALSRVAETITLAEALRHLQGLCHSTLFQPKKDNTSIHIVGLLEAVGIAFDKVWIMDATDKTLPSTPKPNPFIPFTLQCQLQMPHSDSRREFNFTKTLLDQYCKSNRDIIFSFSKENNDEIQRPSYFLHTMNTLTAAELGLVAGCVPFVKSALEDWVDDIGPPVNENTVSHGGSNLLKRQAQCPFRAFAEYRLKLGALSQHEPGLPATLRGMLLHRSLELFWKSVKSLENFLKIDEIELLSRIEHIIKKALQSFTTTHYSDAFVQIEKTRLAALIKDWLDIEKSRPPFTVIACEAESSVTLNGLVLTIRVDRIDQLSDGTLMVIDYKTSKAVEIKDWFGERPLEPQLPLYSLKQENLQAIGYAQVNRDELCFKGITDNKDMAPVQLKTLTQLWHSSEAKNEWELQREHWKITLSQLAFDYKQGLAHVNPKNKAQCNYCHLHALCRIHERPETR